jgi:hypothetical protein
VDECTTKAGERLNEIMGGDCQDLIVDIENEAYANAIKDLEEKTVRHFLAIADEARAEIDRLRDNVFTLSEEVIRHARPARYRDGR